jgi:transposase
MGQKKESCEGLKGSKKASKDLLASPKLTAVEEEVLHLHLAEGLTAKQIATRRGTSIRAVDYAFQRMRYKGVKISIGNRGSKKGTPIKKVRRSKNIENLWRFHGLHYVIKPYYFTKKYQNTRTTLGNSGINYGNWVFKFHSNTVEVQLKAGCDFTDADKWRSIRKAERDFNRYLHMAEQRYGFKVFKEGKCNIRLVNQHLAFTESDVAKAVDSEYIKIKGQDGKVWFLIDQSKGIDEHEYVHPQDAVEDSERIEPYLDDLRKNSPPTNSELGGRLDRIEGLLLNIAKAQYNSVLQIDSLVKMLSPAKPDESEKSKLEPMEYVG